jgi:glycerol-3-phosphate responsive antiterminator
MEVFSEKVFDICTNLEMKQRKQESIDTRKEGSKTTNNVFLLDSKMLDKMIGNAKANNMLDAIEVDFKEDDIK